MSTQDCGEWQIQFVLFQHTSGMFSEISFTGQYLFIFFLVIKSKISSSLRNPGFTKAPLKNGEVVLNFRAAISKLASQISHKGDLHKH